MTTIELVANDQLLQVTVSPKISSGEVNTVSIHVDFSDEWNNFGKNAVFYTSYNSRDIYEIVMTNNECIVPSEVMTKSGTLYIGIRGVNSEKNEVKTTSLVKLKISEGTPTGNSTEVEPTPDVYQQLLTAYGKTDNSINKEITDRKSAISTEKAERQAEIAVERARIDNLSTLTEGSTTADAELLDIRVKADGSTATSAGNAVREQVSELKGDLVELSDEAILYKSKNIYNPAENISGQLDYVAIGSEQTITSNEVMKSQKIAIKHETITLSSIRLYSFVNKENRTFTELNYISADGSTTIQKESIPSGATHLWVSTYNDRISSAQIEYNEKKTDYEPYGDKKFYIGDEEISDNPFNEIARDSVVSLMSLKSENMDLKSDVNMLTSNLNSLLYLRNGNIQDEEVITLKKLGNQKLIINLHKIENDGYDTDNDVYLPNASDDFSDIRIFDNNGKTLAYKSLFKYKSGDVISDERIGVNLVGKVLKNTDGKWIACTEGGLMSYSDDRGKTWTAIPNLKAFTNCIPVFISRTGAFFFSRGGNLFRCESYNAYPTKEFNPTYETSTGNFILSTGMIQHPDGELFVSTYQFENHIRIYRSTDDGLTWESVLENTKYQHIHNLFVDTNQTPVAIYAGCDGGGGIYKSIDKGNTWIDLRENNNFPQASDYGVIYSDPSGYRLIGGETSIVGGYSILKTTDDVNFKPVCSCGNSIYAVEKINGKLYAVGCASTNYKNTVVLISSDEGENWQSIYNTAPLISNTTASGGFRYITKIDNEIIVGSQDLNIKPLRIYGSGCYAEIIVDVPNGVDSLTIKTGYALRNEKNIVNDTLIDTTTVYFQLNEGDRYIVDKPNLKTYNDDLSWLYDGKHLSYIYPNIKKSSDNYSVKMKTLRGYNVKKKLNVLNGLTISFWAKMSENTKFELIRMGEGDYNDLTIQGVKLMSNEKQVSAIHYPLVLDNMAKYDLVINADGTSKTYVNGVLGYTCPNNLKQIITNIGNCSEFTVLKSIISEESDAIQHFMIREKVITLDESYDEFNSYISDNH